MEPLIVKIMLQSKLANDIGMPEIDPQLNLIQKSMVVDSSLLLTHSDWIKDQSEDSDINHIVQLLKSDKLKKYVAREMDSSGIWVLLKYQKDILLQNGLLYQRVTLKNHQRRISQFVLPKNFVCKVILACHDDNAHLGMERTIGLLQERFFWPKMADDVCIHIYTCDWCLRCKQPQERYEMWPILVSYPLKLVYLDFLILGGKADNHKSVNILIVTDHFTIYAQAYITPKQTVIVVAWTLWENFLVHYGWPEKILTHQGKSFENNLIWELCELAQVKKLCTSPHHPETNGQCKCFNATLINMLGTLPTHAKKNWQDWVTTLTHAYNCTVSAVTGLSPYFLMFARTPKISLDIKMGVTLVEQEHVSYQNYAKKLQARLKWAYQIAHENSQRESEHHKKTMTREGDYELETRWFSFGACKSTIWQSYDRWLMRRYSTLSTQSK